MYTQKELDRIVELFNGIEGNKEHEYAAPTYKDSPALKEMAAIILGCTEDTAEVLPEKITVLTYLSKCYDEMCRAGMSVKYYKMLLTCYVKLSKLEKLSKDDKKHFEEAFYNAVKARNWYVPDDCADLKEIVSGAISDKKMDELYQKAVDSRKGLPKNDPIELSDEYLAVIDEVEELVEKNKKVNVCFEYWNLKTDYLEERGIRWSSPAMLNPGVMFD
mgnify:FL=1